MKYKIEKNTVQETLIIPLYSRKLCSELYPNLYRDEMAVHLIDQIDYDFSQVEKKSHGLMQRFGSLEVAMRQNDLAWEVQNYLVDHPNAAVVNLGCGLDSTGSACDNGSCKIYNLDFPDVIAVRSQLLPAGDREENLPCNLNDTEWFTKIDASGGAIFFASGVFYYFLTEQVRTLVQAMADSFPGWQNVLVNMLNITLMLTVNLGILNLLPIPALDGGRLVFLIWEAITHTPVPPEKEGMVHFIGLMFFMVLMVFLLFNDLVNIFG